MWGNVGIIVLIFLGFETNSIHGIKFQLFVENNYQALIYDLDQDIPSEGCHNVESYGRGVAGSLKTDSCILAYEKENCTGRSARIDPPGIPTLNRNVVSFHPCNHIFGAKTVRLDMFTGGEMLASYKDVCGCLDIPTRVTSKMVSLNNYGNCVTVYSGEKCTGDQKNIAAGVSADSEDLRRTPYFVRSVSACGPNPACIKLDSKIYKFVLEFPDDATTIPRNVAMAANTTFHNNGNATITQEYRASKTIRQTYSVFKSTTITGMETYSTEHNVVTENANSSSGGISSTITTVLSESLRNAYSVPESGAPGEKMARSSLDMYEDEEQKTFELAETIQIPPCIEYEVSSTLSIWENVTIPYWVYAKVSGTSSGKKISAEELITHVKEMELEEVYDNYTVIFKEQRKVVVSVGVDTWITGVGSKIKTCDTS